MTTKPDITSAEKKLILARATVSLSGVAVGSIIEVDPTIPYIQGCLRSGVLVQEPTPPKKTRG